MREPLPISSNEQPNVHVGDILERIFAARARTLAEDEAREPYEIVRGRALASKSGRRRFLQAIARARGPAIIGEIKRASPSAGLIARNFDAATIAAEYERAGVDAISVLTESDHFLGELSFLEAARQNCTRALLRKDFLRTPYEVAQSAAYGADAILLIVAALSDDEIRNCMQEAESYELDALVEVHDARELSRARALGARLVGINNRDLRTFETNLAVTEELLPDVPAGVLAISESGMRAPEDIVGLHRLGARGFLIGEALMRSEDRAGFIVQLRSAFVTRRHAEPVEG